MAGDGERVSEAVRDPGIMKGETRGNGVKDQPPAEPLRPQCVHQTGLSPEVTGGDIFINAEKSLKAESYPVPRHKKHFRN